MTPDELDALRQVHAAASRTERTDRDQGHDSALWNTMHLSDALDIVARLIKEAEDIAALRENALMLARAEKTPEVGAAPDFSFEFTLPRGGGRRGFVGLVDIALAINSYRPLPGDYEVALWRVRTRVAPKGTSEKHKAKLAREERAVVERAAWAKKREAWKRAAELRAKEAPPPEPDGGEEPETP